MYNSAYVDFHDVYPAINPRLCAVRDGYEPTETFTIPCKGDWYVNPQGEICQKLPGDVGPFGPRLLVTPKPKPNEIQQAFGEQFDTTQKVFDAWDGSVFPYSPDLETVLPKDRYEVKSDKLEKPQSGEVFLWGRGRNIRAVVCTTDLDPPSVVLKEKRKVTIEFDYDDLVGAFGDIFANKEDLWDGCHQSIWGVTLKSGKDITLPGTTRIR